MSAGSPSSTGDDMLPSQIIGPGVLPYNGPCVAFFAIAGMLLQFPVILTHCGILSRPNVPIVILSTIYLYICLSYAVTAVSWTSNDYTHWWSGRGWCDLDVRVFLAASLGVLSTQCVINWNMLDILRDNAKISSHVQSWRRGLCEAIACLFLPTLNLAVSTFFMQDRFDVVQDIGCLANVDFSAAYIVTYLIWLPILGLGALFMMMLIAIRFWRRGKSAALQSISFIPHMGFAQFVRIIVFSLAVTMLVGPLSISLSVVNFINLGHYGMHKLAWLHGKPEHWDTSSYMLLDQVPIPAYSWGPRPTFILDFITRYINLAIAWLLFLCYGTGSVAQIGYMTLYRKLRGEHVIQKSEKKDDASMDMSSLRTGEGSPTETLFTSNGSDKFNEWEASPLSGKKAFHVWEMTMSDLKKSPEAVRAEPRSAMLGPSTLRSSLPSMRMPSGAIRAILGGGHTTLRNSAAHDDTFNK